MAFDIYAAVTDRIIQQMEQGVLPWAKPWGGITGGAYSGSTGKAYSLLNQMLLNKPGAYYTFNQVQKLGGSVRKGEKSQMVVFWKQIPVKEQNSQTAFSGKSMERPQFSMLFQKLQEGDTLVVTKLDRFARTAIDGVSAVRELFNRGVRVHILNMGLVENTLTGNLILTVMLAFAEYERGMIVERTQTGKAVARQDPNFREGRPKKYTKCQLQHAMELLDSGKSYKQVEAMTGISKSTLIRARK